MDAKNPAPSSGKIQSGFTLVEMLIVVLVLAILAIIITPYVAVSIGDARLSTLRTNLKAIRDAIELYYVQHDRTYPGVHTILGVPGASAGECTNRSFVQQLNRYTDEKGVVSAAKNATYKYGPYLKTSVLPSNPFKDPPNVICDRNENDITVRAADGTTSWKYYMKTGVFIANDGGSSNGVLHDSL